MAWYCEYYWYEDEMAELIQRIQEFNADVEVEINTMKTEIIITDRSNTSQVTDQIKPFGTVDDFDEGRAKKFTGEYEWESDVIRLC